MLTSSITSITDQINNLKYSPTQKDLPNTTYPTTVTPANRRDPPLDGGYCTKNCCMWTLKYEIISPNFYDFLINTKLKVYTDLDLKNFCNHIKMCLNAAARPREELIPAYQYIKGHSEFAEYFIPDCDNPSYSWNV